MVTRVDKKPIIYNTCLIRAIKPAVVCESKHLINEYIKKAVGASIPDVSARDLLDDYEDVEHGFRIMGIDDPVHTFFSYDSDEIDDDSIRIARMCLDKLKTPRQQLRSAAMFEDVCKIQAKLLAKADRIYYGTEAVYKIFSEALCGNLFSDYRLPNYSEWVCNTTRQTLVSQSTSMFIHPTAVDKFCQDTGKSMDYRVWHAWNMFKRLETIAIRIGSRKNMLAHAYYAGINKKGFEPSKDALSDFMLPYTGYAQVRDAVEGYLILGLRYCRIGSDLCVLTHDDCINLSTMGQCYFRSAMYFSKANGYDAKAIDAATNLIRDISCHAVKLIDAKKNFSHIIRSMHIMSQKEFNDAYEEELGDDLGWRDRSENYVMEAKELDAMGPVFHARATKLASSRMDRLNTCFIYHVFVGDEMLLADLRSKVTHMTEKVRNADSDEWSWFLRFVKAYTISRFMMVNKRKPQSGGAIEQLNEPWAERCVSGKFTMPPRTQWGDVWIEGEFKYTQFADTWHLEAQDVAYVVKDSKGLVENKYIGQREINSELLMAMIHGNTLDIIAGSTSKEARDRICKGVAASEVVLTTAPKAENAKPSWKKRVTFAADCEFRKMQAEFDRNCRRVMSFIRGPSLGVDQCILEKQFADIADATATGLEGAICSHDISAWSESMDRDRKFEFEFILINMFDRPDMINIKADWEKIVGLVMKQGAKDVIKITNASFQGFDGSSSTILHAMILIYCLDTARRKEIIPSDVRTNMATLIDDCIALMVGLHKTADARKFWAHLKAMYLKLGFEVDDLKSIFSTIKAIYLSRRFLNGGEVPSDLKIFIKAHSSYEDPLRCTLDLPSDIFGAMRGAADANGNSWFIYYCTVFSVLCELAHHHTFLTSIPPAAASILALAPVVENGWGFASLISWATNDVTDKRVHFNAMLEANAAHKLTSSSFQRNVDVYTQSAARMIYAIKSQAWRVVSYSNIFTNPFEAIREGPLKPDMLRRNAVQDLLSDVVGAEPWKSLLAWNTSSTTQRVRELLIQSGHLHAPTLAALVNCMPDNYRLSLVGKALGSESLLNLLPGRKKAVLKRRVMKCSEHYFQFGKSLYESCKIPYSAEDMHSLTFLERSVMEREEFYAANGVQMTDHTFPDPVMTFTTSASVTRSVICPNLSSLSVWDKTSSTARKCSELISLKGMYTPRRSGRVWEVTCEHAKGWDSVSQRVAMGLAILARARADGHEVDGLLTYFVKSWNELSNITPDDTHLIAIHGNIKRLDANPGSSTHPIIVSRNTLRGYNNNLKSALDVIPVDCTKSHGSSAHLHDYLAHETAMLCVTALISQMMHSLGVADTSLSYHIATRPGCIAAESGLKMTTNKVCNAINIEIMDGADNYGLLQACPELIVEVAIPTMKSSWVRMINALIDRDTAAIDRLRKEAAAHTLEELTDVLISDEVYYSPSVLIAAEPATRGVYSTEEMKRVALVPTPEIARATGDDYTVSVRTIGSKFTRALAAHQPAHIMAATAVRSILWDRMKRHNIANLAAILYEDPDADWDQVKFCSTQDFWRGVIAEVNHQKKDKKLSELAMAAFRSLGVMGLHVHASDDVSVVTHAVASYFGAHLRQVTTMISDLICSISGRSAKDFDKPFIERVVTNNPAMMNAKLKRDHINALIKSNIDAYNKRIKDLLSGTPTHRGDMKISEEARHGRVVELRCRKYVYRAAKVDTSGRAMIDGSDFGRIIHGAAVRVFEKIEISTECVPKMASTFDDTLDFMFRVHEFLLKNYKADDHGWDSASGSLGARLAFEVFNTDAKMVMNTKYAVSASEIAPRLHRRVITTIPSEPSVSDAANPTLELLQLPDMSDSDDDGILLGNMTAEDMSGAFSNLKIEVALPRWQALYTLLITGVYRAKDVNQKLGIDLPSTVTPSAIREAQLYTYEDADLMSKFPSLMSDYLMSGVVFDEDWLNRDEAEAYTTDEMSTIPTGFLF